MGVSWLDNVSFCSSKNVGLTISLTSESYAIKNEQCLGTQYVSGKIMYFSVRTLVVSKLEEYNAAYYHCSTQPRPFDMLCLLASRTKQKFNHKIIY